MKWSDTNIQISNISIVSTANFGAKQFPFLSLFVLACGVVVRRFAEMNVAFGTLLILAALVWILVWYIKNKKAGEVQKLSIVMNSGIVYSIVFYDEKFLGKVMECFSEILSTPAHTGDLTIDIKSNTVIGHAQAIGSVKES